MNIFVSQDDKLSIKKSYPKLITTNTFVLDVPLLAQSMDCNFYDSPACNSILVKKIEKNLMLANKSKKYTDILYLVKELDRPFLYDFRIFLKDLDIFVTKLILLDANQKLDGKIYKFFDEVL